MIADKLLFKEIVDRSTLYAGGEITVQILAQTFVIIAWIFIGVAGTRMVLNLIIQRMKQHLEAGLIQKLKEEYTAHMLQLSHNFHVSHKTGSLITRLSRGESALEDINSFFVDTLLPNIFRLFVTGAALWYFDKSSIIIILLTFGGFVGYSLYIQTKQIQASAFYNEAEDTEKGYTAEAITNIDSVKYYGKEIFVLKKMRNYFIETKKRLLAYWKYHLLATGIQHLFLIGGTVAILYFPLIKVLAGEMTIGTVVFIYSTYLGLHSDAVSFARQLRMFTKRVSDFGSLTRYKKVQNEIKDIPNAPELQVQEGSISFSNITFSYNKRPIFKNFSLDIKPNEKVALVGHSGSGKSTLIKLLYRLYDVEQGRILIDGNDSRTVKQESLRSELAIVPQEAVLFDDTIYNNILFSNPSASRKEVLYAIKYAQLDKIIATFPNKEQTIVGQRGVKLSGGEKQRVSIARALLANKRILVLDEATSALDSQTEHDIQTDLKKLLEGRTAIIIAHRLSTIMHADKIIVLDKGKIVQQGTHRQLITKPGVYRQLWNLQKGGYIGE